MHVEPLSSSYFDTFIKSLYTEWYDIYAEKGLPTFQDVREFYLSSTNKTFIVLHKKTYMGCYTLDDGNKFLCDVFVVPEHRGKGIGKFIVEDAQSRRNTLFLYSSYKNTAFYEKYNFKIIKKEDKQYLMKWSKKKDNKLIILTIIFLTLFTLLIVKFDHK